MITLYSGTPGSGKSYHVIDVIFRCLKWGRLVISNFPVRFSEKEKKAGYEDRFFYFPNEEITVEKLIIFALEKKMIEQQKESQCLVVVDEAGGRFNCRDFKNSDRTAWIDFFSQHRKIGYDFVLVAQRDRMIDRQIRGYLEIEKKHRKINNFGPFWILPFTIFCSIEIWYEAKERVGSEFIIYRQKNANRYDSMKMFSGFKLSSELLRRVEAEQAGRKVDGNSELQVSISSIFKEEDDG